MPVRGLRRFHCWILNKITKVYMISNMALSPHAMEIDKAKPTGIKINADRILTAACMLVMYIFAAYTFFAKLVFRATKN